MIGRLNLAEELFIPHLHEADFVFVGVTVFNPSRMDDGCRASFKAVEN
jgi:hypothetical protein